MLPTMPVAAHDDRPPPFPARAFTLIGAAWVVFDLMTLLVLGPATYYGPGRLLFLLAEAWTSVLAAKYMLLVAWLSLGEGTFQQRLMGGLLFAPVLLPMLLMSLAHEEAFCMLVGVLLMGVPMTAVLAMPFIVLRGNDFRLARDGELTVHKRKQFSIRQLMVLTLIAAVVMALLRWVSVAQLQYSVFGLQLPLLAWVFPAVAMAGLLLPRWYPWGLYALGATLFILALPVAALPAKDALVSLRSTGIYVLFFALHALLVRGLGFRLLHGPPKWYPDPGITFLSPPSEQGIVFLDASPLRRSWR